MTDDPRSHQYNDAGWEYGVDSNQRSAVTDSVNPDSTTPQCHGESNDQHSEKDDEA